MSQPTVPLRARSLLRAVPAFSVWILFGAMAAFVVVFIVLKSREDDRPEVRALVVAQELIIGIDELPKTVDVIYTVGGVDDRAVELGRFAVDAPRPGELVDVVVVVSTPAIQVIGRDDDAERAASYANAVAKALVETLNDAQGIGVFALIQSAEATRAETPAGLPVWPLSILAGVLGGLGVLVAMFAYRRPLYTLSDVAAVTTAAVVDQVWLKLTPPIDGNVRSFAIQLRASDTRWYLGHCSSGPDLTVPLSVLLAEHDPDLHVKTIGPGLDGLAAVNGDWRVAIVVPEGAAAQAVRDAETVAGDHLGAVVLAHRRLARR